MIRIPALETCSGIQHGFLTRKGGVSEGVFDSLNCGYGSGDETANVRANRGHAAAKLRLGADDLATLYQIHSAEVVEVSEPWCLADRPRADAMVTNTPGLALGILTADCVPVLFADMQSRIIGAAHAGWKGALAGVVEATVAAMEKLGAERSRIMVAIGPCIRQPSYEVGPELRQAFLDQDSVHGRYFSPSVRDQHFMFDLAGYVRDSAGRAGVGDVADVARDTYAEEELFYSYRRATHRGESDYGRGISLISLERD
jgi:polyphenol oxidase